MYEVGGIPVMSPDGRRRIGKASVRVEDDGDVLVTMELNNDTGRMLGESLKYGHTGALSFGPIFVPAIAPLRD